MRFIVLAVLTSLSIAAAYGPATEREKRPPNVVIVFVDDLGYGDLGCYGSKIPTPNIDRMAREGMRFTDFYVAQAVCSASRAALLTGCYSNRVGILGALGPASKVGISDRETTIAQMLKKQGFATAIFGKWHLGYQPQFLPTRHGFDEYFGLPYSNDMWPKHPTAKYPNLPLIDGEKTIEENPDQSMLTTRYTERAGQFIEKSKDRPFFLYLPHSMPHVPLFVSDRHKGKSGQGLYGDVVMELDWSVGEILSALKKNDLDEKTLVIFSSDNGPWLRYGNHGGSAGPLREGKGTNWEGGVREPCVMRWPGKIPPGSECHELAATIDILPTLANLCGAELPTLPIDGKDISALLRAEPGARTPHEAYFYYWDRSLQAIRSGKWKLQFPHAYNTMNGQAPGGDGKPGKYARSTVGLALFDLENDVGETKDVAKDHADIVARLQELAEKARDDLGDTATKRAGKGVRPPGMAK
jgi:arylsulfatase A-like enzyme